jgi:hypothetical protein
MAHRQRMQTIGYLAAVFLSAALQTYAKTIYVWIDSPIDGPGTNWNTAYHEIQSAVDAASPGNAIIPGDTVLVTNGIYSFGINVTPGAALYWLLSKPYQWLSCRLR